MSIYQQLFDAGVPLDCHESDLYAKVTPESRAILKDYNEIAHNDPLAVRLTKQAINRSLDSSGLRKALTEALEIDVEIESTVTPESRTFNEILRREGAKAAVEWRRRQAG